MFECILTGIGMSGSRLYDDIRLISLSTGCVGSGGNDFLRSPFTSRTTGSSGGVDIVTPLIPQLS